MKAYLSSTFADLVDHRERAFRALQSLTISVIAMEDYVASDERPVERCLTDVETVDLYVGLFAFRYGYIPTTQNPESRSITELEYRRAVDRGIPRLIFMVPENAQWEVQFLDAMTGEGGRGERIRDLRAELASERLVSKFTTPDQLGAAVTSSVSRWLLSQQSSPPTERKAPPPAPHPRQLNFDLLLLHVPADQGRAAALGNALSTVWRTRTSTTALRATSSSELRELDRLVTSARATAVLLSPAAATTLAENRGRSTRILSLVRDRSGGLLGISAGQTPLTDVRAWGFTHVVQLDPVPDGENPSGFAMSLHRTLVEHLGDAESPEVGLPVIVVAMTETEADELLGHLPEAVAPLIEAINRTDSSWTARYGPTRSQWRPFAGSDETIEKVLESGITALSRGMDRLRGRRIRVQSYPLDALLGDSLDMWPIYQDIARTGCLVVVDELSLFHARVRQTFATSPLPSGEQVAFVTVSPLDPFAGPPYRLLRQQLDTFLAQAARRFSEALDPLCEMGISERRRLNRWLYGNLPQAVAGFRAASRDPEKIRDLELELGLQANPGLGRLIAGESGPG